MKRAILLSIIVILGFNLFAQSSIDKVLTEIEKNNTTLLAYRKSVDAEKIGNKTGLTPQNPEVEFNYLWGSPSVIGNRTDFSIKQSFDFPTAYSYKNQIANLKNEQAELEYKKQRSEVLHQARMICIKLTYYNALNFELRKRYTNALSIAEAYKARYDKGDAGILDYNKARINELNVSKELKSIGVEQMALLSELTALNAGNAINFTDSLFQFPAIPAEFDQWYAQAEANNPVLQWVKQEIVISEKQVKLTAANGFPKIYGGYMSEKVVGQQFQGITLGVTIPLWENKNTVKYARAQTLAIQNIEADAKVQFYNAMKALHTKAIGLQKTVSDFRNKLAMYSNAQLLEKAFNKGEISLTEYMYELSLYYQSINQLLEMEMNCALTIAELNRHQN